MLLAICQVNPDKPVFPPNFFHPVVLKRTLEDKWHRIVMSFFHSNKSVEVLKEVNLVVLAVIKLFLVVHFCKITTVITHTDTTHNRFTALLEFVRDYLDEQVPER